MKRIKHRTLALLASVPLVIDFGLGPVVGQTYRPPPDSAPPPDTVATGTRGNCQQTSALGLTLLAPHWHIGQTTSQTPTFVWYIPESDGADFEFQIYPLEAQDSLRLNQVKTYRLQRQNSGLITFSMPEPLAFNQTYRWRVIWVCHPNRPSTWVYAQSLIKVVPPPETWMSQVNQSLDLLFRAQKFATAGFWFDAFHAVNQASQPEAKTYQKVLIEQLARDEDNCDASRSFCRQGWLMQVAEKVQSSLAP